MILCILLVSNSWGCCLAVLGDHKGPVIAWCNQICPVTTYIPLIKNNSKFESRAIAVGYHVTTRSWWQVSLLSPSTVAKCGCNVFCGRLSMRNRAAPDWRSWRQRCWPCGVFKSCISAAHYPFQQNLQKFYTTMVYPCFRRSVWFSMGSPAW